MQLSRVISVDPDKCINCHHCISVCPVKYCNDGSGDHITYNPDLCIGCGECLKVCTHGAREIIDDFDEAMELIEKKEKFIAITAPSIAAVFPEQYLRFNGWLKSLGIDAIFDVSFGAELTGKSLIEYIKSKNPEMIIASPCPVIVNYIEIYHPELIKYLAPVDSPMIHLIKMIHNFYPQYSKHKIFVVSPCIAKKREFEENNIDAYNVTMYSIKKYLNDNNIDLTNFPEVEFENPCAERAVMFSTPGGLL